MILYPTETLYAIGVNALDSIEVGRLFALKGREEGKAISWLVRSVDDIRQFAEVDVVATKIAERFLPGPLTLVLRVKDEIPDLLVGPDRTVGFRISSDGMAQAIIDAFMSEYDAPLTCTSANVSGAPTLPTVGEILQQFGDQANLIDEVHDDGVRKGLASTVVKVTGGEVVVLREGAISEADILAMVE
jgi:L-threonylcarbamoyladenylate synthase